jgi:general secretion pathway protein K
MCRRETGLYDGTQLPAPPQTYRSRQTGAWPGTATTQHGIALLVVLWVVALLSLIAGSSALSVRTQTSLVDNLLASAKARAAAQAGVHYAVSQLLHPDPEQRWRTDGTVYEMLFSDARLRIAVTDEAGKIDLNAASGDLLGRLLRAAGIEHDRAAALVDAILDWRDPDDLHRLNGAEKDDYRAAGSRYLPRNGPFQSRDEVALVAGMQPGYFAAIQDALTVHSGSASVDPAVAVPLVRAALDLVAPGPGTGNSDADQSPANSPAIASPRRNAAAAALSVHVQADMPSGARQRVTAVIKLRSAQPGSPFSVLAWQERID